MREKLAAVYLDYVNNYLTIATFAEHYKLTETQAKQLIDLGRSVHEDMVAEAASQSDVR